MDLCLCRASLTPVGASDNDLSNRAYFPVLMHFSDRAPGDLLGPDGWPADHVVDRTLKRMAIGYRRQGVDRDLLVVG